MLRRRERPATSEPFVAGDPIIGMLYRFAKAPIPTMLRLRHEYGNMVSFDMFRLRMHLVSNPDDVRHILRTTDVFTKNHRAYDMLKIPLGEGLLTSSGAHWLRQRRLMQPSFRRKKIAGFAESMIRITEAAVDRWIDSGTTTLDANAEMLNVTMRIIAETMLSSDLSGESAAIADAVHTINEGTSRRISLPLGFLHDLPLPQNVAYRDALTLLDKLVYDMIDSHRKADPRPDDLLSMLLDARDEDTGDGMNDRQLRDEVLTIFAAGHETTAHALTWTLKLLSEHPHIRRRLQAEVDAVVGDRAPTHEDYAKLVYTKQCLQEAMRLYPPAWIIDRMVEQDTEVGGYTIPKGDLVIVSPYVMHRHPDHWDNPEGFDPDRFHPDRAPKDNEFVYFPFGGGPRICIGNNFSLLEGVLVLASINRRVELNLVPGHPIEMDPLITLRPKHGVKVSVVVRANA